MEITREAPLQEHKNEPALMSPMSFLDDSPRVSFSNNGKAVKKVSKKARLILMYGMYYTYSIK